jgi:HSP20 family protein
MTTLVRWSPFRELESMERRMRRMLDDVGIAPEPLPAADIYEQAGELVVELEVPGFDEKDLQIEVTDHTLCVKGERKEEKEKTEKTFQLRERLERSFERRFAMPDDADLDKLVATYKKGVLEIHAPKVKGAEPRKVEISSK